MHQKQGTCAFPVHSCILIPNETKIVNCGFAGVIRVAFHNQVKKPTVLRDAFVQLCCLQVPKTMEL
jgi:hypothetical protein